MKNRVFGIVCFSVFFLFLTVITGSTSAEAKNSMQFVAEAKAKISEISPEQVMADLDAGKQVILLDVRDSEEYNAGHLPKAIHISRGNLEFKVRKILPDKDANIVVYCSVDLRSALAAAVMKEMGYTNVKNMRGGFKGWGMARYPIYNRLGEFIMISPEKEE
jgi:rhodanese-related sulfurtransferase